jgi:hypothetical protein
MWTMTNAEAAAFLALVVDGGTGVGLKQYSR